LTIQELEKDKSALYEILWYLQTKSPEQATALLELLRSNQEGGVGAVLQHFAQYRKEFPHLDTTASNASSSSSSQHGAAPLMPVLSEPLDLPGLLDARGGATQPVSPQYQQELTTPLRATSSGRSSGFSIASGLCSTS
jgi:hypothetical protein